ncbi:MAG: RtcB family protein [Candidatus Margulisiibacteriota bacterium]|nr:RtcB family protein [Candidatus Margulisiibacteriota bacterium]
MSNWQDVFEKVDEYRFKIPKSFQVGMRVDGLIYTNEAMIQHIYSEKAHLQVANVACLPGIVGNSLAMPDIHFGYGFPIGGVAAFDPDQGGIVSPGGVGYDINCGVRLLRTNLHKEDVLPKIKDIVNELAREVPSGVGSTGPIALSPSDMNKVLSIGSQWAVKHGYGTDEEIVNTEEHGRLDGADADAVSKHARERGRRQLGTLGAGNHFLEVQIVDEIYDQQAAEKFGIWKDQVTIMIHSGSRGLGHQVCSDFINVMRQAAMKYRIQLPDKQLCCAPINSPEAERYLSAMAAAANYAWCNRQLLMHWTRESFSKTMGASPSKLGISLVYDVCHNVAKKEKHGGKILCVHRKGATRAFPGDPVLVPGDMGRYSYIMTGTEVAMQETWGSVCHGAGRMLSRSAASRKYNAGELLAELEGKGIIVRSASKKGLVEEAPGAYKDVREVVDVVHNSGLAKKVARMRPVGVVKG